MDKIKTSKDIDRHRRLFVSTAALTVAAAQLGMIDAVDAQPGKAKLPSVKLGSDTSFSPLKQIDAGLLNVGYVEAGPADGPPVLLLHGWPYDNYSFVDVTPQLASAGYRVIVPYLRGYGTTRFLSSETFRNGQPSAVALDIVALMDALKIRKATLAGFDWGARTANIIAALWPERCNAMVSVSGYLIGSQEAGKMPLPPKAELEWWYQFYFATERGREGHDKYRHDFSKLIWRLASPKWNFTARRTRTLGIGHNLPQEAPGLCQSRRQDRPSLISVHRDMPCAPHHGALRPKRCGPHQQSGDILRGRCPAGDAAHALPAPKPLLQPKAFGAKPDRIDWQRFSSGKQIGRSMSIEVTGINADSLIDAGERDATR